MMQMQKCLHLQVDSLRINQIQPIALLASHIHVFESCLQNSIFHHVVILNFELNQDVQIRENIEHSLGNIFD